MMKKTVVALLSMSFLSSIALADPEDTSVPKNLKIPEITEMAQAEVKDDKIKNKLDYPASTIVAFVEQCSLRMMQYMPMHPMQSRPISIKLCNCLMDQFRSDFDYKSFSKGGTKLAEAMAPEYSEVCKQLEFGRKTPL